MTVFNVFKSNYKDCPFTPFLINHITTTPPHIYYTTTPPSHLSITNPTLIHYIMNIIK